MNYKLTENQVNNLMVFLDRVPITGHHERQVMNDICYILINPIQEINEKEKEEKTTQR